MSTGGRTALNLPKGILSHLQGSFQEQWFCFRFATLKTFDELHQLKTVDQIPFNRGQRNIYTVQETGSEVKPM